MPTRDFNGPVIEEGDRNVVLRDALFHSPVARVGDNLEAISVTR